MALNIIAAIGRNRELGKKGRLLWKLADDMRYFRVVTLGKPVIMGRKTFESIGRPLPGRQNIVITRSLTFQAPGAIVVGSLDQALSTAASVLSQTGAKDAFVIGGAEVYREALPLADRLYLTLIDAKDFGADTFFPAEHEELFPRTALESPREENGIHYRFVIRTK